MGFAHELVSLKHELDYSYYTLDWPLLYPFLHGTKVVRIPGRPEYQG